MTCPLCDLTLDPATLLPAEGSGAALRGFRCTHCHGAFVPSDLYAGWHEPREASGKVDLGAIPDDAGDVKRAKLCPQDGRIMRRYRVTADGAFWIDRCSACGGVWFDGGEWEATVEAGLHESLPQIFSDAWQRAAEEAAAVATRHERLVEAAGPVDVERTDAFRAWVWAHPQRHLLLARVNERPDQDPAS